jgi:hypothetical protein
MDPLAALLASIMGILVLAAAGLIAGMLILERPSASAEATERRRRNRKHCRRNPDKAPDKPVGAPGAVPARDGQRRRIAAA